MQVKSIVLSALVVASLSTSVFAQTPATAPAGGKMMGGKMAGGKMAGGKMAGGKMMGGKMAGGKMATPAPK